MDAEDILKAETTKFADGLDVVYKRLREVKDNSKALGFSQMGKQKCHFCLER